MKRIVFCAVLGLLCSFLVAVCPLPAQGQDWQLVYAHDAEGEATDGSLEALKEAVRKGHELRISFSSRHGAEDSRWVEHTVELTFLTIMSDTLVAGQIRPIIGQTPDFEQMTIVFKENLSWSMLASTSGLCDTIMREVITGEIVNHSQRRFALKWFVRR